MLSVVSLLLVLDVEADSAPKSLLEHGAQSDELLLVNLVFNAHLLNRRGF